MTTLLQRCEAVKTKVERLTLAQRHATQQREVYIRSQEWKSRYEKLKAVSARAACLSMDTATLASIAERRAQLRYNAEQILQRLTAFDDITKVTEDASWTRLLASVEGLYVAVDVGGKSAWKNCIEEQGALEDPTWLRNRAQSTSINDAAIAAYRTYYSTYAGLVKLNMPRSPNDLTQLNQIVAACRKEAAKIDFNVPPDVQKFFEAIQSGGATLSSLTSGVLEWLAENEQLDQFRVRSVGL
jgi:hypothetical protein